MEQVAIHNADIEDDLDQSCHTTEAGILRPAAPSVRQRVWKQRREPACRYQLSSSLCKGTI